MTLDELLTKISTTPIRLRANQDDLIIEGDRQDLTPSLVTALRTHKIALLDLIGRDSDIWWIPPVRITPEMLPLVDLSQDEIDRIVDAVPGGLTNVQDIYPLAPLQEGILFHHLMEGEGDAYLLATQFSIESRSRLNDFLAALQAVIDRHDILRTAVFWEGLPQPVQVVLRQAQLRVEEVELDQATGDGSEQLYARYDPRHFRIDISQAPLLRISIAFDPEHDRWLAMLLLHHLAGDHITLETMQQEIQAYLLGQADQLPAPLPFRNLVAQARLGVSQEEHAEFFRQMLADVDEPTAPFGLLDVRGNGSGIEEARLEVDEHLAERIRANARHLSVSAASLCHVAWGQVLARLSGREDVVFGTVLFGRMQGGEGAERALGLFINTLPLRIKLGDEGVEATVRRTHILLADLMRHEHASLALAQRYSSVPAPAPLFSALLNYRHSPGAAEVNSEETIQAWQGIHQLRGEERSNYPFTLTADDLGRRFRLTARTPASIGPARICRYMHTALESLVHALENTPLQAARYLDVLPAEERQQVLYGWNDTEVGYGAHKYLHELFEEQALRTPDAVAVVHEGNELSYVELNRLANRLAHYLIKLGVQRDARVAICVERGFEMIAALLAVLKAGCAYVPLDPAYPVDRLKFMLLDSAPVALLTQAHLRDLYSRLDLTMPIIDLDAAAPRWDDQPMTNPDIASLELAPEHLAYVIYTSGSTGNPKGVMISHRNLTNYLQWAMETYYRENGSGSPVIHSIGFDGLVTTLFGPLIAGQAITLLPHGSEMEVLGRLGLSTASPFTLIKLTPSHLKLLNSTISADTRVFTRALMIGGEALVTSDVLFWQRRFPEVRLINHFGPTEATVGCCTFEIIASVGETGSIPIGRPIANTRIYILDAHGEPVPIGVAGELYIGGNGVARGYLNLPELTREKFPADHFASAPHGRMYRTGDLGRWTSDGNIEFLGRNDFQVKIRGFRIELGEIESRLMEHPVVRDAVVIACEETQGDKRLVAYYTAGTDASIDSEQLRSHLAAALPEYMVPVAYVRLQSLPLTHNGKLDRRALPAPGSDAYSTRSYEQPQGEIETKLAQIWAEALGLDRVGRYDHFFALGGHSLVAMRVVTRLRQELGLDIALRDLFTHPVMVDLAHVLENTSRNELPRIIAAKRSERLPLSLAQQRLWFLAQMDGVSQAYHIHGGLRLRGALDHDALRRTMDRILVRHEALRTTFIFDGNEPVQQIALAEQSSFALLEHDLREQSHVQRQTELDRLCELEPVAPFDLERGPLVRGRLIRLTEDEQVLLITMHHIVSDGWSMGVLVEELSTLYRTFRSGLEDSLPELEIQYADYALWQRQWIEGEILQEQAEYWKTNLAGAPGLLEVPADHPRPAQKNFAGASAKIVLDEQLTASLRAFSGGRGTTLYMTLLAAWAVVLSRLSGQQDVVIGTPTANRGRAEIEGLIGFFVNTLALRLDLSGSPTVSQLLDHVKAQTLDAQQHQDIPFEHVVELINPVRSLAHGPLFQVMFAWQNNEQATVQIPGLETLPLRSSPHRVAKFDLTLSLQEAGEVIVGGLEYATSLFEAATAERFLGYFRTVLEAMVNGDTITVDRLPMVPKPERNQLLYEWNETRTGFPSDKCVHQLFEEQAERTQDAVAVVYEESKLSYSELNRRANRLAHYLRDVGVKPDARVAICVERGFEMIVALLAVLKAGGAYVPLDPAYPADRLRFMLRDSEPVAVLTQAHLENLFPDIGVPVLKLADADTPWSGQPDSNPDPGSVGLAPQHLAYVIYTSGSTGQPKGVMISHRNLTNYLSWAKDAYYREDGFGSPAVHSIGFDGIVTTLFGPIIAGQAVTLLPHRAEIESLQQLGSSGTSPFTLIKLTPSHLKLLNRTLSFNGSHAPTRTLMIGGEALVPSDIVFWQHRFPRVRLINHFGPTEATVGCCTYEITAPQDQARSIPIGRPIWNTQVYILDEYAEPVPVGVAGELYIGGAGVARGYLNRPELTMEKFLPDPFSSQPEARMYRTGDLTRWLPDGNIEFLGRNDFQVKIHGFRIEPGEIEAQLMEHPDVREAVVMAREDSPGDKRLVAYFTATDPSTQTEAGLSADQLRSYLFANLPPHMVPAAYVRLESLPLTPNGKLDRKALPAPEGDAYAVRGYEAPQGEAETKLAAIWADVLMLDRVGRHDNFFALGGHSLLIIALVERMRRSGLPADVRTIFACPTVAALAAAVVQQRAVEVPPNRIPTFSEVVAPEMLTLVELNQQEIDGIAAVVPGGASNVQDIYPLAPLQEGILFHHLMGGEGDPYLLAHLLGFQNRARLDGFLAALQALIDRHDILRTAVLWEGLPEPIQVVYRTARLQVAEVELDPAPEDAAKEMYDRFNPRRFRIDIRYAPLLRVHIAHDRRNDRWLAMLLRHHLAGDHTTLDVILREIQAHLLGEQKVLSPPVPYRNVVAQARLGISKQEHEAFFRQMLGDVDEPTAPFGLLEVRGDGSGVEGAHVALDDDLALRLRAGARRLGVSAASICHLAWARVLATISGRRDVVFGTVLFGRMQSGEGADQVLGLFINTLPLRIQVDEEGLEAAVHRTHGLLADLMLHEHASLALAQRCSAVPAPTPLFSALLNYRHSPRAAEGTSEQTMQAWEGIEALRGEERTNYPLTLSVNDLGDGFSLDAQTVGSIDPMRVCAHMHTALNGIVEALETSPTEAVGTVAILPPAERKQVLYEWNDTYAEYPREKCVHELFAKQAEKTPDAIAVVFENESLTYAELNRRSNQLAHYLRALGVGPDARVAICAERSLGMVVALLAVLKAGGAYVPLDPGYPVERLRFMIEDSAPVALLTQKHLVDLLSGIGEYLPVLDLEAASPAQRGLPETDPNLNDIGLGPQHLAYVIYTSGSTGLPKGVMVPHRAIARLVLNNGYAEFDAGDRVAFASNPSFDAATLEVWAPLLNGGSIVVVDQAVLLDPVRFAATLREQKISVLWLTVGLFNSYAGMLEKEFAGLRYLIVGGDALNPSVVARVLHNGPPLHLINGYGPTETTTFAATYEITEVQENASSIPIGRPIANTQIYILDAYRQPVPVGVTGELYIAGDGVARGYLNRPELTEEKFVPDPFSSESGARMYRTGDLGRWLPDGNIEFLGRNDLQAKIRGFRIEPGEIEARLMEYPWVREAAVIVREDTPGDKRLVAYYAAKPDALIDAEELRSHLAARLSEYMVPVAYVQLQSLPLTRNGKLDRSALPAPEANAFSSNAYEPPQGEIETKLAQIWTEVLKIDQIGRHDNFFRLGGHSLLAVSLIERMRRVGFTVDVRTLFTTPTLAALAAAATSGTEAVEAPPNMIPSGSEVITPQMIPLVDLSQEEIGRIVGAMPGGAANVQDIYPLAPLQEGIFFHHLMVEEGDPYLLANLSAVDTRARLNSFLSALQAVIDRHDILRTALAWEGLPRPVQVVLRRAPVHVEEIELDPAAGEADAQLYARFDPRHHRIDLRQAPMLRVYVSFDISRQRWLLLILWHHIIGDHTTLDVIREEIGANLLGRTELLPKPAPFRNVVAHARLGISEQEHQAFFRQMLGDVDESTAPFGLLNVRGDGRGIEEAQLVLDNELARRIRASARKLGVSAASLCHLAWAQVLARVSGREDVVFGTVLFGRMQGGEGADRGIGLFINTLPMRIKVGDESAETSLRHVHNLLADLLRHEHASLALAQRCSAVPAPTPLFSAILNYRHSPGAAEEPSAETKQAWQGIEVLRGGERTNYPFALSVNDLGEGFALDAQAPVSVGPARVCAFMNTALQSLVESLETSPAREVCSLEALPIAESRQVLYEWNDTSTSFPSDRCIHQLFEEQAERTPEAIAIVFEGQELSYRELNHRSEQLALYLRQLGVRPNARVAICVERGVEMIVALLAVLKAGGAYVPMDPAYPFERLNYMLEDSEPVALLTQEHLESKFIGVNAIMPVVHLSPNSATWPARNEPSANADADLPRPEDLAYVIYTSGSTGRPKGVMVEHRGLCNLVAAQIKGFAVKPSSRVLQVASFSFDACASEVFMALCQGAALCLLRREQLLAADTLTEAIAHYAITHATLTPAVLASLPEQATLDPVQVLIVAGEKVTESLVQRWNRGRQLINGYGPTEATICATMRTCSAEEPGDPPIGRPIANTRVYILDAHGRPAPIGVAGEMYVSGIQVARGYLNRPELTEERFVPDPFNPDSGTRMYRTGDLGRWLPDGNIEFLGRNDFQVKIRGFRIELGEIEASLVEYAAVREAVVTVRENTPGDRRLVAYYTTSLPGESAQENPSAEQLRSHLSGSLPEYMVPAAYVRLESLPLTPNGKLDRMALPAPDTDSYSTQSYEPPLGEIETKLAQIWAEVLRLERVGRNDNFFALGGHSLMAITLIERMRRCGFTVDVRVLFATPTVAELAATGGNDSHAVEVPANLIRTGCESITPQMLPLLTLSQEEIDRIVDTVPGGAPNVQDIYPLAPLQEGILFHHLMAGEGDPYLLASLSAVDTRERLNSLLAALQTVIDRHDMLRTAVLWEGLPEPVQVVLRRVLLHVEEVQLDPASGEADEQMYARFDPRHHRIDLRQAPILRVCVAFDAPRQRCLLLILLHHIVGDHTTLEVIREEIQAQLLGRQQTLAKPTPYRNVVAQARLGISEQEHEAFFRQMLGDIDEPTAPFGLFDVRGDGTGIEDARVALDHDLARRIRASARKLGVSAASLCHVAWAQVLSRVSGREDVVFGTVLFGRMQGGEGTERGIGLFINTLPIRIRVGEEGAEATVRRTHALLADLMRHEHASLALAQRCSAVLPPTPLFSSLLNYRYEKGSSTSTAQTWEGIKGLRGGERTNYPFALSVNDLGEGFSLDAQAPASVGPARVCAFMSAALEGIVESLETSPARAMHQVEILSSTERQRLLCEWNDTSTSFPSDRCIHQLFEEQAERTPEAIAIAFEEQELSYRELNHRSEQLAQYLRQLGVRPDARVAICAERGFEMIVALLAVLKAGGAYVPMDPAYPVQRLYYMLEDSEPVALLTQAHLESKFVGVNAIMPVIDLSSNPATWPAQTEPSANADTDLPQPENLAYVIYTSGSTGRPKGVMVEHRGLCNLVAAQIKDFAVKPSSRVLQVASFSFDACASEVFMALCQGASLHLARHSKLLAGESLTEIIKQRDISHVTLTPAVLSALPEGIDLGPIETLILAGEAVSGSLVKRWGENRQIINAYGPTEATVCATIYHCRSEDDDDNPPIGRPLQNVRIYILDDRRHLVPQGVVGEVYIAGVGVARGYLHREDLTTERFLPDPFLGTPGSTMYRTGDLGRWRHDGTVGYLGRNDFQVKIRGFRVELGEIETRLLALPEIREALVKAYEFGANDTRLVAYFVPASGIDLDNPAGLLRGHLAESLPDYMVPAAYVCLESLPLTPNGKLDHMALPAPDSHAYSTRIYEPPQGEIETNLAGVWAKVLRLDRVGRHDNFFALGGHSLLTVRVAALLEQKGITISVVDLYTHTSLKSLADSLAARCGFQDGTAPMDRAILIRTGTALPPLFLAHCGEGELIYAPALTSHIDPEIEVHGLPARPISEASPRTIEAMATRMVKMVRSVQPMGPYRLAGWSTGGALAYEIATQLLGADQEIEFVGMFDTNYPAGIGELPKDTPLDLDDKELLLRNIQSSMNRDDEQRATLDALRASSATLDFAEVVQKLKDLSLLPEGFTDFTAAQARQWLTRTRTTGLANKQYITSPIPVPVHLFTAGDSHRTNPTLGWNAVIPDSMLRVIPTRGTHQSMMQSPNVESLGQSLSRAIRNAATCPIEPPEKRYSPLFTLQAGKNSKTVPLFCIPGAGGNVTNFMDLASCLDRRWDVYGLQPRGLDGTLVPHSTISSASGTYLRAIDEIYPKGPIHLLGHSFGGWVAFEMAGQLIEQGRQIASLVILDTEAPDIVPTELAEYTHPEAIIEMVRIFEQIVDQSLHLGPADLDSLDKTAQIELLHGRLVKAGLMPYGSEPNGLQGPLRTFSTSLRTHYQASKSYSGPVQLLLADDKRLDRNANLQKHQLIEDKWRRWAPKLVSIHAPGNHMTMLKSPYVADLAHRLDALLANEERELR